MSNSLMKKIIIYHSKIGDMLVSFSRLFLANDIKNNVLRALRNKDSRYPIVQNFYVQRRAMHI